MKTAHPFYKLAFRLLLTVGFILTVTFIILPFRNKLAIQIIVLIFLLPIMVSTVAWGLASGIFASLLAFLAFNYFYLEPYHTFRVRASQDLITLIIFLIVAVVMSQLIGQAREGIRLARIREWEATRMYELISALAGQKDSKAIAEILATHTQATLHCQHVEVSLKNYPDAPITLEYPMDTPVSTEPTGRFPLTTPRGSEGTLCIWRENNQFTAEESRLLEAYSSQGALALERIRLTKSETKARVLEESDQLKTSLLNSVSHELRSPLAAIKASVSSLRSGTVEWEAPARKDLLETIEEETDHLNQLVGNLLDMSRIESGALNPQLRWNSIGEIVRGVTAKMRKQLQSHTLVVEIDDSLPLIPSDYVLLEQVFTNLLSNSSKYAPPNTTIQIQGIREDDFLHMIITNEGPLVAQEHLERIFDKFYRVTEADRITGTGLGLSICKGIIEAHHGKIWAENQPCCFAFHILLPYTIDGNLPDSPKEASSG